MKKSETQEQEFLEVCSSYDHDLLTGKREMTLKDYERITYLVSYTFHMAILDINLPDGNGFQFCKWLKARSNTYRQGSFQHRTSICLHRGIKQSLLLLMW